MIRNTKNITKLISPRQIWFKKFPNNYLFYKSFSSSSVHFSDSNYNKNNPLNRTLRILGNDMKKIKNFFIPKKLDSIPKSDDTINEPDIETFLSQYKSDEFPTHCDVLIIGGGGVGSSIAYWLKKKARDGLNVVVVEKDSTYSKASTVLSVGGLRQQFSLPENIQMSLYGADFIRTIKEELGDDIELNFTPYGYLTLASESGAETLRRNSRLQNELGARNEVLTATKLKQRFPWLNTDGIELGCHGLEKEGWFDPWALLMGFRNRAKEFGAQYVNGEVVNFEFRDQDDIDIAGSGSEKYEGLEKVVVKMPDGENHTIKFAICVVAAGAQSGEIGKLAKIGTGKGILKVPLPVVPRKRFVYVFKCQGENEPGMFTPLTIDPDGTYFRRDGVGGNFLSGKSPCSVNEPCCDNLDVDHSYFETDVWPTLAKRVPAFENIKCTSSWAGFYEFNSFDENGIIGPHPYYHNLYIATGFSGHGIQQTPAVGRAISELIIDGCFRTIDLTRLGFDRILVDEPMFENNIV